jgi:nucleotide-binding universal stress UspA family protein
LYKNSSEEKKMAAMTTINATSQVSIKRILYLTDFSEPSEAALPFAVSIARNYGSVVNALHILTPPSLVCSTAETGDEEANSEEEFAQSEMLKLDSQLSGIAHETNIEWGGNIWATVAQAIQDTHADLLILGTRGRTGTEKLMLGSVAEEVFRKSIVPVLTIGPSVSRGTRSNGEFRRVLLATDLEPSAGAAARYAISIAQESQARLILLHVIRNRRGTPKTSPKGSVAEIMHRLAGMVPEDSKLYCRPELAVEYGDPATTILRAAKDRGADLIVMGVHPGGLELTQKIHLECATAHKVIVRSLCPVLIARNESFRENTH